VRSAISDAHLDATQEFVDDFRRHDQLFGATFGDLARCLAADCADQLFQAAYSRFPGVVARNQADACGREFNDRLLTFFGLDAIFLDLPRDEVALGDVYLLFFGVAGQLNDFHAVEQWRRDGVQLVGCADEEHLAQVEGLIEVVVAEGVVLLGVESFEERAGGIATEVAAQLVNLVEHKNRIVYFDALQMLDDLPGESADVGAAMAANLCLVVHASEGDSGEFAT
jgi:hypothetical protein